MRIVSFLLQKTDKEGGVMARGPNEKIQKAEELYHEGIAEEAQKKAELYEFPSRGGEEREGEDGSSNSGNGVQSGKEKVQ